ncbi:unnamed protein product [Pleuronectes platessa]|uniref:Uncharacterized protein n=1 Tax=Pleuronectes platessa TaxID=8262 RepID=A0A9N7V155_PLEPL|nr:unnamed protein product [Pleuronectes platessa]
MPAAGELRCVDAAIESVLEDIDSAFILKEEHRTRSLHGFVPVTPEAEAPRCAKAASRCFSLRCDRGYLKQALRSLGRFDIYFVRFIISDLSRSDTPEDTASHASLERASRSQPEEEDLIISGSGKVGKGVTQKRNTRATQREKKSPREMSLPHSQRELCALQPGDNGGGRKRATAEVTRGGRAGGHEPTRPWGRNCGSGEERRGEERRGEEEF